MLDEKISRGISDFDLLDQKIHPLDVESQRRVDILKEELHAEEIGIKLRYLVREELSSNDPMGILKEYGEE